MKHVLTLPASLLTMLIATALPHGASAQRVGAGLSATMVRPFTPQGPIRSAKGTVKSGGTMAQWPAPRSKSAQSQINALDEFRGGPPANNDCSGAILLTPSTNCVPVTGDVAGATQSIAALSCNAATGNASDDVWYRFVATATSHTIRVQGSVDFDAVVDLRSGACNGTNIACADATFEGEVEQIIATGLTIGATYRIRVYDYYTALPPTTTFTICVFGVAAAPSNDECTGANIASLSVGGSVNMSGDNTGATDSEGIGTATVWEAFEITSCADITVDYCGTNPVFGQFFINIVDGCPFVNIYDTTSTADCGDGNLSMLYSDMQPGIYYIPVLSEPGLAEGPYNITVSAVACGGGIAPPNDECSSVVSVPLSVGSFITFNGDNTGATASVSDGPFADPTVWHKFTTIECADVTLSYCATTTGWANVWIQLATDCPVVNYVEATSFEDVTCANGNYTLVFEDLPAGTYWLPVLNDPGFGAEGPYTIQVSAVACGSGGPGNDACGSVIPSNLSIGGSVVFTGDNTNSTAAGDALSGTLMDIGGDTTTVWHAITLADCANLTLSYCGTAPLPNTYWAILATSCPADDDVVFFTGGNFTDCVDGNATIFFANVPAGTYYIPVRGEPASWGPYTLEVGAASCVPPPANDPCTGAFTLAVNLSCVTTNGTTAFATESLPGINCNGAGLGDANDDVWYSFVATGPNATITVQPSASMDAVLEVFSGSCAGLTSIGCDDAGLDGGEEEVVLTTLTQGVTYYVRVYHWFTLAAPDPTFTICVVGDIGTGMDSNELGGFQVFPNPSNGDFSVVPVSSGDATIELFDLTGRVVYAQRTHLVKGQAFTMALASDLAQGTYTLRLTSVLGTTEQRVIVK